MKSKLSILSIVIATFCLFYGLTCTQVNHYLYEFSNGPALVTSGFCRILKKAQSKKYYLDKQISFGVNKNDSFWIGSSNYDERAWINVHAIEISPQKFNICLKVLPNPVNKTVSVQVEPFHHNVDDSYKTVSEIELNEIIDKYHFPDKKLRAKEKRAILEKIKKYSS